ncbi:hypothetical protein M431DRAFT_510473 [Trichoderma harzianum CBS 226.95]|uniref:Uncharacterized protein n=1 Tax=Trichoderma harzianum CBS 226.95 TaxID=983964 RepID=A0A2T4A5E4_TRIHA|nr:hypothetical protein M431DRAFT_510473 [Trichoderma harzianum CBS 226.95]PTB52287.1 hypothetical protein M431DRAFT_510473 [Trichoderma harzianum CBS 226.95]
MNQSTIKRKGSYQTTTRQPRRLYTTHSHSAIQNQFIFIQHLFCWGESRHAWDRRYSVYALYLLNVPLFQYVQLSSQLLPRAASLPVLHYVKATSYANVGCRLPKSKPQLLLEHQICCECIVQYITVVTQVLRGSFVGRNLVSSCRFSSHLDSRDDKQPIWRTPYFLPHAPPPLPPLKTKKAANAILVSRKATRPRNLLFCHVYSNPNGETYM